jgi:CRISPR/Cas system CMR subunit Cmr6 (Cas7 group RAMP superfamily)
LSPSPIEFLKIKSEIHFSIFFLFVTHITLFGKISTGK